jgi:hypothetical protein
MVGIVERITIAATGMKSRSTRAQIAAPGVRAANNRDATRRDRL